jgi:hypothetical protein
LRLEPGDWYSDLPERSVEKRFQERVSTQRSLHSAHPDFLSKPVAPTLAVRSRKSGCASIEMTKGRLVLPGKVVAGQKPKMCFVAFLKFNTAEDRWTVEECQTLPASIETGRSQAIERRLVFA